ncbi:SWIM zinc finger family protein [Streptomyces sp. NBC_01381]|uniref:SWIM zinc finger family protein n=1 Tax=Streptomyces sp. NBC_01381 TaxID=2903845 RepID=UPI002250A9E2|nr:SWIM zinc finger family protein [Streptomyces sp. NBC_01381]MCX4667962.1 SWIM zinc finger family protein [Streptomyces sp. NBC_01381]
MRSAAGRSGDAGAAGAGSGDTRSAAAHAGDTRASAVGTGDTRAPATRTDATRAPATRAGGGTRTAATRTGGTGRVFPPLPQYPDPQAPFATSWWGNAWIAALEGTSLDPGRLSRGRAYAREGHVDTITVAPGRIVAYVHGSRPRPYRAEIRMRTLTPEDWDTFLDAVATEPAHIAALLDKDMPHALAEAAERANIQLLPGPGDLVPSCSCPDHGRPCKHAAALTYQTARLLDADPFVLLLLRGGDEAALLDELAQRNAHEAAREQSEAATEAGPENLPGTLAREALATDHRPPLPPPLAAPAHAGDPPLLPSLPGAPDPTSLEFLATDTASRAHAFLTTGADPFAAADPWHDAVRLAASHPGLTGRRSFSRQFTELARAVGHTPTDLSRAAAAWRQGAEEGLSVLESPWDPPAGPFDRARGALITADLPRMTIHRNHLTNASGSLQLRYGRDGRWYPYRSEPGRDDWWPEGEPDEDPVGAVTGMIGT